MKTFLKGVAVTAIILVVLMAVQIFCNTKDIHIDITVAGTAAAISAMLLHSGLTRNDKKENEK